MVEVGEHCHHGNLNHPSTVTKSWMPLDTPVLDWPATIGPPQRDNAFAPYPEHNYTFGLSSILGFDMEPE